MRRAKREWATPLLLFCLCLRRRLEILRTPGNNVCVHVFPLCISSNILRWSSTIVFASSAHYPLTGQRRGLRSRYANARNAKPTTKAMALGDGIYDPPNSKDEAFSQASTAIERLVSDGKKKKSNKKRAMRKQVSKRGQFLSWNCR